MSAPVQAWAAGMVAIALLLFWRHHPNENRIDGTNIGTSMSDCASCGQEISQLHQRNDHQRPHHGVIGGGLVFVKTFKTGSTSLATYITQVGHQRGSYFLHPKAKGWFARGELESRRDKGQTFDISLRHVTPYTPYSVLEELVPEAVFVTIMRHPVERFLSLFNFRGEIKNKFKTPQALVTAIRAGKLPQGDARPFCNQLAWLMSGRDVDLTKIEDLVEASRVADEVIKEAERRGVVVLITERMAESLAVLANLMQWDMDKLELNIGSQRVQGRGSGYYTCPAIPEANNKCLSAIRGCNLVDELLYEHYGREFEDLVRALPPRNFKQYGAMLDEAPKAKRSMSKLELGTIPINCINRIADASGNAGRGDADGGSGGSASGESHEELYNRLHSCEGRPRLQR